MALVEVQLRMQAFIDFFKNEINRQRLPSRTIEDLEALKGKLLQRIECVAATVEPSAGATQIRVQADFVFHHNTLAAVRAAGSLQAPVTAQVRMTIPVTIAVVFEKGAPSVRWSLFNGALPGKTIPLSLPGDFIAVSGAVVADENIVAIRLGTNADDQMDADIVDRVGADDWAQLVSGQVIADVFVRHFRDAIQGALSDELVLDTPASGAWFPAFSHFPPRVGVSATVVAVDACIFDIDVPVDLQLTGTLQPTGPSLVTTVELRWEPDSTLCEIVGGLLFTPIAFIAINAIASDKATEKMLGSAQPFEGFEEIARDDDSITYQQRSLIATPSPQFTLERAEATNEGLVTAGVLSLQSAKRNLQGEVSEPSSGLKRDCTRRTVFVEFRPGKISLRDYGVEGGPPRLLPDGITFDPPNAWVLVPGASNTWLDLTLAFLDPPTGRLPVGTATSVYLHTDCGLRWADLGAVPAPHPPPTTVDIAEMLSHCMAISDRWGMGVLNLEWLVDPPDFSEQFQPLRLWTVGARDLPRDARLKFVAVNTRGAERTVATIEGQRDVAVHIVTDADETLQIRGGRELTAPAPIVSQRWVVPFASVPLASEPVALASSGRVIAVREAEGATQVIDLDAEGAVHSRSIQSAARSDRPVTGVIDALARAERRDRVGSPAPARVDRETVALSHRGALVIGKALPPVRL